MIILIGLFIFITVFYESYTQLLIAFVALTVTIVLFIISIKMDKISTIRMLVLLDENKRKILTALEVPRTFEDLTEISKQKNYKTKLRENLNQLKDIGIIDEEDFFVSDANGDKWIKKFTRSF